MYEKDLQLLEERYELSIDRIRQIPGENLTPAPFRTYFEQMSRFLIQMNQVRSQLMQEQELTLQQLQERCLDMYADILPEHYAQSYANPVYAQQELGEKLGKALSFLYTQLRGIIAWNFDGLLEETVLHQELFLEIYQMFCQEVPSYHQLQQVLYWFFYDNCDILASDRVRQFLDPEENLACRLVCSSDLSGTSYLYEYGVYISQRELDLAQRLNGLGKGEIAQLAQSSIHRQFPILADRDKPAEEGQVVSVVYPVGAERLVKAVITQLEEAGIRPVLCRAACSAVNRFKDSPLYEGYASVSPDSSYEYDHMEDAALFLDRRFVQRRLAVLKKAYETFGRTHQGQIVTLELMPDETSQTSAAPVSDDIPVTEHQHTPESDDVQVTEPQYVPGSNGVPVTELHAAQDIRVPRYLFSDRQRAALQEMADGIRAMRNGC